MAFQLEHAPLDTEYVAHVSWSFILVALAFGI